MNTTIQNLIRKSLLHLENTGMLNCSVDLAMNILNPEKTEDTEVDKFWNSVGTPKCTQLERYELKKSPIGIQKFIAIGGGPKMGTTLEKFARFHFKKLHKRNSGKCETGYDHIIKGDPDIYVEQKSSGHWKEDDYKWQHVEENHKWTMLLLCGIDYTEVKFWGMNRKTFHQMIDEKKIVNQGNKAGESSEGKWFNYSDVKHVLVEIKTDEDLLLFRLKHIGDNAGYTV